MALTAIIKRFMHGKGTCDKDGWKPHKGFRGRGLCGGWMVVVAMAPSIFLFPPNTGQPEKSSYFSLHSLLLLLLYFLYTRFRGPFPLVSSSSAQREALPLRSEINV